MISSALTPMNPSEAVFTTSFNDGAAQNPAAFSRGNNPRITLTSGEIFINGTHASNTASVEMLNGAVVRVQLVGIETRDFNILDVDSIKFFGRKGNDHFTNDTTIPVKLYGHEGNDQLKGGGGNDLIWGGWGNDLIVGNDGNDQLYGQAGDDSLHGRFGNDFIYGANGNDLIRGNEGNDFITGDAGDDDVRGGDGNDVVHGWTGNDVLTGDYGHDYIDGYHGDDRIVGGGGNDQIYGGYHDDEIFGSSGNDTIDAGVGNDQVHGESGDDIIRGQAGHDEISGGPGNDTVYGGSGNDQLLGNSGKDSLHGGSDRDVVYGGNDPHADTVYGDTAADSILYFAGDEIQSSNVDLRIRLKNNSSNWTNAEVVVISEAMDWLYEATGNNELLRDRIVGKDVTLEKFNSLPGGAAAINYMTINTINGVSTYNRVIRFADWNENNELLNPGRKLAFVHELAHNFDNQFELAATPGVNWTFMTVFRSKSGWTQNPPNTSQYSQSGDGQWWYKNTAQFHRSYGRINPSEDWATMWELFFHPVATAQSGTNLAVKLQIVRNFINSLK